MPVNRTFIKLASATHLFWYRLTGGFIGGTTAGGPVLLLTTTGRKTGRPRTTPLMYLRDGENMVVIASNGGNDQHPAWYLNLRARPEAEVELGSKRMPVRAEAAGDEERARLWPLAVQAYRGYERYQQETKRKIPVVILRPAP